MPIKPRSIASRQVRIIFATAFRIIATTKAILHKTIPKMITRIALCIAAIILEYADGNAAII